jgi:Alginate export
VINADFRGAKSAHLLQRNLQGCRGECFFFARGLSVLLRGMVPLLAGIGPASGSRSRRWALGSSAWEAWVQRRPCGQAGAIAFRNSRLQRENSLTIQPSLTLTPLAQVSVTVDMHWFWRLQTADGLYSPSGQLLRGTNGSTARFVGGNLAVKAEWQLQRHVTLTAT